MHKQARSRARSLSLSPLRPLLLASAGVAAAAALFGSFAADASNGLAGSYERAGSELQMTRTLADLASTSAARRSEMSDQEFFSFSGVGAIVCTINGEQRNATAFLVGAFDIGVTVAHPFVEDGKWVQPESCVYTATDSL